MKESNFDSIVRNGIMQNLGKTPEQVLTDWMQQANFKIGILPLLAAAGSGLKMLLGKLGENLQSDVEQYSPTPEDWGAISPEQREDLTKQLNDSTGNGMTIKPDTSTGGYRSPSGSTWTDPTNDGNYGSGGNNEGYGDDLRGEKLPSTDNTGAELPVAEEGEKSGGMGMAGIAAIGIAAILLMSGGKSKK
jgi:hypothetical protein